MNRRHFLHTALASTAALMLPFGPDAWVARAAPADAAPKRLIVIMLRGAVDGLNVVAPYGDPGYAAARPSIAIARPNRPNGLIDLDGHFGLHPALASLMPLWNGGSLAFVHASGSPDPTRSHFDAQLYIENGTPGRGATTDGWMNRMLGTLPGPHPTTQALAFGPQIPRILTGAQAVANLETGNDATKPMALDRPQVSDAFAKLYAGGDPMSRAFQESQQARQQMRADLADPPMSGDSEEQALANGGAPLPNGFPGDAARLARMIRQDPAIRLAFLALGGWDTHVNQGGATGQLAGRLQPLGDGLARLASDLGTAYGDTLILVVSEFGRTVHENGNHGTDHGHGNVMWLLGGNVAGRRVWGEWPGLDTARLYQSRDLAVTTDYRSVVGAAVARHFHLDDRVLRTVFPDMPGERGMDRIIRS